MAVSLVSIKRGVRLLTIHRPCLHSARAFPAPAQSGSKSGRVSRYQKLAGCKEYKGYFSCKLFQKVLYVLASQLERLGSNINQNDQGLRINILPDIF
jgi:hypothetical protein